MESTRVKSAKLEDYVRWKQEPGLEEYLDHGDVPQRRLWTKLRGGCLELRVETGRWERLTMNGVQVPVPRRLRRCKLCFGGVENARHVLLRCPTYRRQRAVWAETVRQSARPAVAVAASTLRDNADEELVMQWMMKGGGQEAGMQLLVDVWRERAELLGERGMG